MQQSQPENNKFGSDIRENNGQQLVLDPETGIDSFLVNTVRQTKDRLFVLGCDAQIEQFALDTKQTRLEFPDLNSYHRLIVHRNAVLYNCSHVVDKRKRCVILYKTEKTAVPPMTLREVPYTPPLIAEQHLSANNFDRNGAPLDVLSDDQLSPILQPPQQQPSFKIMQRNKAGVSTKASLSSKINQTQTIQEREEAYKNARAKIFQDDASSDVSTDSVASDNLNRTPGITTNNARYRNQTNQQPYYQGSSLTQPYYNNNSRIGYYDDRGSDRNYQQHNRGGNYGSRYPTYPQYQQYAFTSPTQAPPASPYYINNPPYYDYGQSYPVSTQYFDEYIPQPQANPYTNYPIHYASPRVLYDPDQGKDEGKIQQETQQHNSNETAIESVQAEESPTMSLDKMKI